MRKIISNTTPILSLLRINKLSLLKKLYGQIIIPFAVYQEIENGRDKLYYQDLLRISWIEIQKVKNPDSRKYLFDLDDGEAEVLVLANEINSDLVILDEIMGRRYARQLNLKVTGTMGVLLKAKEEGYILSIKDLLTELAQKGIWLNPKLIAKVLKMANEE